MTKSQSAAPSVPACRDGAGAGRTTSNFDVVVNPLKLDVIIHRNGDMEMHAPANDTSRAFADKLYAGELNDTKPGTRYDLAVHEMRFESGPRDDRTLNVFPKPLTVLDDSGVERRLLYPGTQMEVCSTFVIQFKHYDPSVKYENGKRVGATREAAATTPSTDVGDVM